VCACARAQTWYLLWGCKPKFTKLLSVVILCKYTGSLTFENFCQTSALACSMITLAPPLPSTSISSRCVHSCIIFNALSSSSSYYYIITHNNMCVCARAPYIICRRPVCVCVCARARVYGARAHTHTHTQGGDKDKTRLDAVKGTLHPALQR